MTITAQLFPVWTPELGAAGMPYSDKYNVVFAGEIIVERSRDPETDLARALQARGHTGNGDDYSTERPASPEPSSTSRRQRRCGLWRRVHTPASDALRHVQRARRRLKRRWSVWMPQGQGSGACDLQRRGVVMGKNKIEGPFVALLLTTLDSPAWQALSHGSKWLYVALKRRKSNNGNRAYISYRTAQKEIKSSTKKIGEWFAELKHYGFIELVIPHSLGLDGKGKAPHWRLTECGRTSKASENGLFDPPTNDFLKSDGTLFDPKPYRGDTAGTFKNKIPSTTWIHLGADVEYTPVPASDPHFKARSVTHVGDVERASTRHLRRPHI